MFCSHKKDFLALMPDQIDANQLDMQNKLIPVLKQNFNNQISMNEWIKNLLQEIKSGYEKLLPFTRQEKQLIKQIQLHGKIEPTLLTDNAELIEKIKLHPALLWAISKANK